MNENSEPGTVQLPRRMRTGFAALIVLALIVAGVALATSFMAAAALGRAQAAAAETARIDSIRHDLLEALRHESAFLLGYRDDYAAADQEHASANQEHMQALTTGVAALQTRQDALRGDLSAAALTYDTVFAFIVKQAEVRGFLEGNVRAAADDIEGGLAAADDPRLAVALLAVRAAEKDYLLGGTAGEASAARAALDDLRAAISESDSLSDSQQEALLTQVRAYQIDFAELVAIEDDIDASVIEARDLAGEMEGALDGLAAAGQAAQERASAQLANILGVARIVSIVLLVATVAVGGTLARNLKAS